MTETTVETVAGAGVIDAVKSSLGGLLGAQRLERWLMPRAAYSPTLWLARGRSGALLAAALTSSRGATAAIKIADAWWASEDAVTVLLDAIVSSAQDAGHAAVKWELHEGPDLPVVALGKGFVPLRRPWQAKGTEAIGGAALWLTAFDHEELGYYAQTTMYTCGAVAGLTGLEAVGLRGFSGVSDDREDELRLWRLASNFPACEPLGLAVALAGLASGTGIGLEVALDSDDPVLLDNYSGFDYDFRAELQVESARAAAALGIPVRRDKVSIDDVVARIELGAVALLLIDEFLMHQETGPHWIAAHATADGFVLVEDPWLGADAGETWIDSHDLPVRVADLDRMVAWGERGLRGVVFVEPHRD